MTCYLWKDKGQIPHITYIVKTKHTRVMKSISLCNSLISELKFPEMYYSCDKNENNMSVLVLPKCILFLWRFGVKIKWKIFSSNSETSPFCLHLLSVIIASLDMQPAGQAFRLRAGHSEQATLFAKEMYFEKTWSKRTSFWSKINQVSTLSPSQPFSSRHATHLPKKGRALRDETKTAARETSVYRVIKGTFFILGALNRRVVHEENFSAKTIFRPKKNNTNRGVAVRQFTRAYLK